MNEEEIIKEIEDSLLISHDNGDIDPAQQAIIEAGGGEAEGWELAEEELIRNASHGDDRSDTIALTEAGRMEQEIVPPTDVYGESDSAHHQD